MATATSGRQQQQPQQQPRGATVAAAAASPGAGEPAGAAKLKAPSAAAASASPSAAAPAPAAGAPPPQAAGVSPAPAAPTRALTAEDYWSPAIEVPDGYAYQDSLGAISPVPSHDGTACFQWDEGLWQKADHFKYRWSRFRALREAIDASEGGLAAFSEGYKYYGLNRGTKEGKQGLWYREWAPGARAVALVGDFNGWDPDAGHWAAKNEFGTWELFLPDGPGGERAVPHRCRLKCRVQLADGAWADKIPAWIKWATQGAGEIPFNGAHWEPEGEPAAPGVLLPDTAYAFKYPRPPKPRALRIYECHVGMSSEQAVVSTYVDFTRDVLPRIRRLGYNAIQIMAVQVRFIGWLFVWCAKREGGGGGGGRGRERGRALLGGVVFCFVLFCFVLFCFVLFCFVLFCFVLFCFVLFCFVLFCFVLFCPLAETRSPARLVRTHRPPFFPSSFSSSSELQTKHYKHHQTQEHAYYGSFGYHVTNFFATSSRCGTPEDLKVRRMETRAGGETTGGRAGAARFFPIPCS